MTLRAPWPHFGGKSRVAAEVWARFGAVRNLVEPFCGSAAVLLARPQPFAGVETVNDADGLLCNLLRAIKGDPAAVAEAADWPVSECDLTARHLWLVGRREDITARLIADPDWFDAKAAGWWVWGACAWIGSGWCSGDGPWRLVDGAVVLGNAGQGVNRKLPHLGDAGRGVNRKLPHLGDAGRGVNRQLPHLWAEQGITSAGRRDDLPGMFGALSARLRRVRIACGDWTRVLGDSVTWRHGLTGVFLDPPYAEGEMAYSAGDAVDLDAVRAWAVDAGRRPDMRIALCGYSEHDALADAGWTRHRWKARGGYANQGGENVNRHRESCWFSPGCLGPRQPDLFAALDLRAEMAAAGPDAAPEAEEPDEVALAFRLDRGRG